MLATTSAPPGSCHCCAIRHMCVFGRLGTAEHALLEPHLRQRMFHRGDTLVEQDKAVSCVRVVKLGTAFAYRRGLDDRTRPIGVLARGNAFGIFGMLDSPSQVSVVALTTLRVCEITVTALRDLGTCESPLLLHLIRALVDSFAAVAAWSEVMRLSGVVNQLAYVAVLLADANRSPVVELPSQSDLAELLGTRRETIARALRTLDGEGGIRRLERKRCEVDRRVLIERVSQARAEAGK